MASVPAGCFWAIQKPFDPNDYFQCNGYKLLTQEKLNIFQKNKLVKLWQRKYLFFGPIMAVSIEIKDRFYFYEHIPGQLYACDIPNAKLSAKWKQKVICFFWYPDTKSCGLKVYVDNKLIRHIESEIDYAKYINFGQLLETEDSIISISNTFNPQQLTQYLNNLNIEIPPAFDSAAEFNSKIYTLTR